MPTTSKMVLNLCLLLLFCSVVSANEFTSTSGSHEITEGRTVILPCAVREAKSDLAIYWRKGDEVLFVDTNPLTNDERYELEHPNNRTFNLKINDIIPYDSGLYECVISSEPQIIQRQLVVVQVPPDVNMAPEGDSVSVKADEMVSLKCYPAGNPPPKVTWRKKGGPLPSGSAMFEGEQLVIQKAKESDSGIYECSASNGVGDDAKQDIQLVVNSKDAQDSGFAPWVKPDSLYKAVSVGQDVNISCEYDAKPIPTVSWQRHGFPVDLTERVQVYGSVSGNHSRTIFAIKSVTEDEFGEYTCTVQNNFGVEQGKVYVSGYPGPVEIVGDNDGAGPKDITLRWQVHSKEPVTAFRISYRPLHGEKEEYEIVAKANELIEKDGFVWETSHDLKGKLKSGIAYYIGIEAKNTMGWGSKPQKLFTYLTNKGEERESQSQDISPTQKVSDSGGNNASSTIFLSSLLSLITCFSLLIGRNRD